MSTTAPAPQPASPPPPAETYPTRNAAFARSRTRTVLQMEEAECGAASLAMMLGHYGQYVPLEKLRIECGVGRDGASAAALLRTARARGLTAAGWRLMQDDLEKVQLPAIIYWNRNHWVVLEGRSRKGWYINDPASGHRHVEEDEFRGSFSNVVLTMSPGPEFAKSGVKSSFGRDLFGLSKGMRGTIVIALLIGIATTVPAITASVISSVVIDNVLIPSNPGALPLLLGITLYSTLLILLMTFLQQYVLARLQTALSLRMSANFIWHLLRLPTGFFSQRFAGGIVTRVQMNDDIAVLVGGQLATAGIGLVTMIIYAVVMAIYSLPLAIAGIVIASINMVILLLVSRKRVEANNLQTHENLRVSGTSFGGLSIIESIKAEGTESDFFARWAGFETHAVNANQSVGRLTAILTTAPGALGLLNTSIVLILGSLLVLQGDLQIGALVAFQGLMASFLLPIESLVTLGAQTQTARASLAQVQDVLHHDVDPSITPVTDSGVGSARSHPGVLRGEVELRDVSFGYVPNGPVFFQDINVHIEPGMRVALVGASGSGKSTLGRLITGLYHPWSGRVLLDDQDRASIPRDILTASIAAVSQDIYLFPGTVMENIAFWNPFITEQDAWRALEDACVADVVRSRPGGLYSQVMEDGRNFSGGQAQRLEIARALAGNPSIIILDEATSALDAETEVTIDSNLRRRGLTCVIIAHRLSTIRDSDEIVVLDQGKVVERGTHEQLVANNGMYFSMIEAG